MNDYLRSFIINVNLCQINLVVIINYCLHERPLAVLDGLFQFHQRITQWCCPLAAMARWW